ncbi:hypothetical protein F3Y22_tig00006666pilonHSYRG00105 [Hibiscus syriacus]|uniref:Peptidase S8/S53 domain-containing protein n=1 Tax=Hibiscus syriacus TaxID=106335 RepID=A0A6A3CGL8_HIBSY|nr:hypothetical protein F3Y22_tig00006666pilonHSYRG00105 [Hibiscus syriacus]
MIGIDDRSIKLQIRDTTDIGFWGIPTTWREWPQIPTASHARITPAITRIGKKPAPFMAAFSSKGPNTITPEILKKGQQMKLSTNAELSSTLSCPHISGIVGLLKSLYPNWSPAVIRSAIMTSDYDCIIIPNLFGPDVATTTLDNSHEPILNASYIKARPFSYGAGHVQPNHAYDLAATDYLKFLCTLGYNETLISLFSPKPNKCRGSINLSNFNYPSITIPRLVRSITVTRTVKNIGSPGTYITHVRKPIGISVYMKPTKLKFKKFCNSKLPES